MSMAVSKQWTRVRTLGRGASGAEVFLAADDASSELFAVKSASASGAAALRREQASMADLHSPCVVACIGGSAGRDGSYQLFLEFAPGGSLADEVARVGGLDEPTIRSYTADMAAGLAYLHGSELVHGDVKARNVVIGADGRAKLADFGCSKKACAGPIIGGTPAFMGPEVARGEEQGPAADVWALGCTIVEMATGRAPWGGTDGNALAAMHRIGYTDAVPEVPQWLSDEAKDFLAGCFIRRPNDRCTAAQLLEHPFLAFAAGAETYLEDVKSKWVSPKSTLDAAFWESESDSEDELSVSPHSSAERLMALACPASEVPDWDSDKGWIDVLSAAPTVEALDSDTASVPAEETTELEEEITSGEDFGPASALPDWDSNEGWIDVLSAAPTEDASDSDAASVPAEETTELVEEITSGEDSGPVDIAVDCNSGASVSSVGDADDDDSVWPHDRLQCLAISVCHELVPCKLQFCNRTISARVDFVLAQTLCFLCFAAHAYSRCWATRLQERGDAAAIKLSESQDLLDK